MTESMEITESTELPEQVKITNPTGDSDVNKDETNDDDAAEKIQETIDKKCDKIEEKTVKDSSGLESSETKNFENKLSIRENKEIDSTISSSETPESKKFYYNWKTSPILLCSATEDYVSTETSENFTKGCQWSPDGTCLLVPAEDYRIRIYELPRETYGGKIPENVPLENFKPALSVREGGLVYDSCWYPLMNSWNPETCCFLSTSRESPIHLWDAFTGELRATYRPYNQVDEVEAAVSVQFVNNGAEVWCGFKGALRIFDTNRPGRQKNEIAVKKDFPNVFGLVSCIRENPVMPGLVAFGTYSKCVGLYKDGPLCSFKTDSGVTQIEFSPCGTKLYTAVRRSDEFLCWDLRNPGVVLHSMKKRQSDTNQRIQFAVSNDGSDIVSGGTDGFLNVWQPLYSEDEDSSPISRIHLSKDCINGVSLHKFLPILATSSGQRHCDEEPIIRDSSVRLWFFQAK